MRFLTPAEWQKWCTDRNVPLRDVGWIRPDIRAEHLHIADLKYPADSGAKVSLARYLFSLVAKEEEETLLLVDDWAVWPSSQHMPLFTRFREALGERRPLIEAQAIWLRPRRRMTPCLLSPQPCCSSGIATVFLPQAEMPSIFHTTSIAILRAEMLKLPREFRRQRLHTLMLPHQPSNHAMERTADRRTLDF